MVEVALRDAPSGVEAIYFAGDAAKIAPYRDIATVAHELGIDCFSIDAETFERVADAKNPQPVLATWRFAVHQLSDLGPGVVLVADNLRDPGNAGAIIRSAVATGVAGVVLTGDCVDPFNPKVLRATAGAIFRAPVVLGEFADVVATLHGAGRPTFATVVAGGRNPRDISFPNNAVIVIGSESHGLAPVDVALCHEAVTIPMASGTESLNAGVAAALILFEAFAQHRGTTADV